MGRLIGKVALITGGAGGCGLATSELFAREGAKVAILDLPQSDGVAVAERINASGGNAYFIATDVSNADQVETAVTQVEQRFGPITVLMNHAGTIHVGPFLETSENDWDRLMAINVKSMFLVTRAVLPGMISSGGGSVICTSSISGVVGTPMEVLYCTTKGACHMFARAISVEFRNRNIRSNAVCPGFIGTAHGRRELDLLREHGTEISNAMLQDMQGRLCDPTEVAAAALFLASDDSSFVNGTHLFVDNAYTAA
ncbi:SDR family NAD(P)-dependent oxidoreductase [Pseudomonas sp. CBSPBW29]|jgi:NAD(P)-dependent dehydrogenase (short-subunit alcohol dehydrogenase family)|uniref:SDR family NAD(P)-dependent oxidoreductase n=1 Tax=Pseudomonas sp. CBS TaxID=2971912 RepID=UPI0021AC7CC0|nr:SDR family NAD(P)-dependent oxidoreductase [Pseudomonas sp. CBS]WEL43451.1 SDR family NAD(P)-dependent oxidoreductase [Pseudomonas sp. CBSPBW29]WEL64513.1 SDR family NAD(P)-dependent oxidoreductase [Pseudomonas sp. CBSPGW29]WEL67990.1 SDR family NAD(P)-dependent oxidoreductase [Pseudomonas sp. CBSPCGW29]WEL75009.1 SDR family NAD(P)-dependent oxidoreductase [Pseudomonas sp. CBSPAW29]WEL80744.1 SDR family NAD(P)-dependent oxidoreductase [Pseudomonas sp. CBSPCAW29]WEL89265.1 SDR family NAD(P)